MTDEQIQTSLEFFSSIGIQVKEDVLTTSCVPGLSTEGGVLTMNREELSYPGDLFYAAARIAVTDPAGRPALTDDPKLETSEEMAALSWAYAAAHHLGIDAQHVFHPHGYHNQSADLIAHYSSSEPGLGVPMLYYWGMATVFPNLNTWLRPSTLPQ